MQYFRLKRIYRRRFEYLENWRESGRAAWKVLKENRRTGTTCTHKRKRTDFESSFDFFNRNLVEVGLVREEKKQYDTNRMDTSWLLYRLQKSFKYPSSMTSGYLFVLSCWRSSMSDWSNFGHVLSLYQSECHGLLHWELFVWEYWNMALDATLWLIGNTVLAVPLAFAELASELSVAFLSTLIRCQFVVRRIESLWTIRDVMISADITDVALVAWWRGLLWRRQELSESSDFRKRKTILCGKSSTLTVLRLS